jgi:hypothetical protein
LTLKRDSSTARPDPEIDKTDLRERIKASGRSARMTTPTWHVLNNCGDAYQDEDVDIARRLLAAYLRRGRGAALRG